MKTEWHEEADRVTGKQRLLFAEIVCGCIHMETSKNTSEVAKPQILVTIR